MIKRIVALLLCCSTLLLTTQLICFTASAQPAKYIALTFDDGPHPRQTRAIMDVLEKYGIHATFFVIGINVKTYRGIVREELERGHEIGNHTYTHPNTSKLDKNAITSEILDCESEVFLQTGKQIKLFRPPEGAVNTQTKQTIRDLGYTNVLWTLDTRDWAHTPPEQIAQYIIENAQNADIILMHDYIGANSPTVQALELFIPALIDKGFTFVTVGELLSLK